MIIKQELKRNFTKIYTDLYKDKKLCAYDRDILNYISTLHRNTNLKQEKIANELQINIKTVKKSIANLKKLGYLEIKKISMNEYKYKINYFDKKQEQDSEQKEDEEIKKILDIYNNYKVFKVVNKLTQEQTIKIKELINKNSLDTIIKELKLFLDDNKFVNTNQLKYFINSYDLIIKKREEEREEKRKKNRFNNFTPRNYTKEDFKQLEDKFFNHNTDENEQEQEQEQEQESERARTQKEIFSIYIDLKNRYGFNVDIFNNMLKHIVKNKTCKIILFNELNYKSVSILNATNNEYKSIIDDLKNYIEELNKNKKVYN